MIDQLILHYASSSSYGRDAVSEYNRKLSNYQLYNNILNQADFERECNPLGIEVGQFKDEIQPYNKTPNKIQVLLGEELKRPFNYRAVLTNSEGIQAKQMHKKFLLRQFLMNEFNKHMSQYADMPEAEDFVENIIPPEKIEEYFSKSYRDAREHLADQILQYLSRKENLTEKKNDGFKHGLIAGEELVWVGVENGEPVVQVLNPLGVIYHKSPDVKYVEDGLYAGYRTFMSSGDILDKFGDQLSEDDIKRIEGTLQGVQGIRDDIIGKKMKYYHDDVYDVYLRNYMDQGHEQGAYGKSSAGDWLVTHVEWRSQRKVGFLTYFDEFGDKAVDLVSENFTVPAYATKEKYKDHYGTTKTRYNFDGYTLEWGWIPEIWQGVRIGDDIYCSMGPKEYQYRSLDNPKSVRLGYHGVIYNNMNAESTSLMDRMKPFQYLYFILVHKLKKLIARDRGKVFPFDVTMVPEELGLEKTLYYLEEMDIDFYNPLSNAEMAGIHQRSKITGSIDRSNMQHILNYVQLMAAVDEQISDVAGITRQREGRISAQEAVTNSQQTIMQSSTITEAVYFYPHDRLWENVLNSLVQCAQTCWKHKSIKKQYVLDDLSVQTLELTPDAIVNDDFGVFISNSAADNELFQELRNLAQPLIQNDKARFSDIIELLKSSSVGDLSTKIEQSEKRLQEEQLEQIRAQQEAQQQQIQAMKAEEEAKRIHEKELQAQKDAAAYERELLKIQSDQAPDDSLERKKVEAEIEIDKEKLELEEKKIEMEAKQKEKDRQADLKIAKMKPKGTSSSK